MPGNYNYTPERYGGEKDHDPELLHAALLEADGTALSKEVVSYVWAERNAEARVLAYLWSLNRRFANQWDPSRMTDFLPRWERILGLRTLGTDTTVERQARVKAKMELFGAPATHQVVEDLMRVVLGEVYVGLVHTSAAVAVGQVPGGAAIPGGAMLADGDWYSTVAHLAIQTMQPVGMDDDTFYTTVAQVAAFLDDLLPAWVTFDWFLDGPHGPGFFLDEPRNLDNQRFR